MDAAAKNVYPPCLRMFECDMRGDYVLVYTAGISALSSGLYPGCRLFHGVVPSLAPPKLVTPAALYQGAR